MYDLMHINGCNTGETKTHISAVEITGVSRHNGGVFKGLLQTPQYDRVL